VSVTVGEEVGGKIVGGIEVLVGIGLVFVMAGVSVVSMLVQDTKMKSRRIPNIFFIMLKLFHREDPKSAEGLLSS
jgi:hypothetical protein